MVKTKFNNNILELMKSNNLDDLYDEWIELKDKNNKNFYKNKKRDLFCICGNKIQYPIYFLNINTGHTTTIGSSCKRIHFNKYKIKNIKNVVYDKIFKSIPNQIINIDNLINYSLENMNDVINKIINNISSTQIKIENERKENEHIEKVFIDYIEKIEKNKIKLNNDRNKDCENQYLKIDKEKEKQLINFWNNFNEFDYKTKNEKKKINKKRK